MPKAVITGGAGFIGSNLAEQLISRGWSVIAVDDLSHGSRENISAIAGHGDFRFVHSDIRQPGLLEQHCRQADCLIHLAAYKIPRYGDALKTLTVNNESTKAVLECAAKYGLKTIVASTSDVYGKNATPPFSENHDLVLGPSHIRRWAYAASKIFDEQLALAYHAERELPVVILRFFGSYGPRNHRSWWGGPQAVFIEQALRGKALSVHGDGQQSRSFCYIEDTVAGIMQAADSNKALGMVVNIGSADEMKIIDLARLIIKMTNSISKIEFIPYGSFGGNYEDVRRRIPDLTRAASLLGFQPRVALPEGLDKTIAWHRRFTGAESD